MRKKYFEAQILTREADDGEEDDDDGDDGVRITVDGKKFRILKKFQIYFKLILS